MIDHPHIRSSLRAHSNHGNMSERVRRKSNRFLLEITAMIRRVGLWCLGMLTLRSEAAGKQLQTPSIEFLDKDMVEDIQH